MRKLLIVGVFLAVSPVLLAQQVLTNDSVMKLTRMGFTQEVIITTINRSPESFDTSPTGLATLKSAGVGALVVSAMISRADLVPLPSAARTSVAASAPAAQSGTSARTNPFAEGTLLSRPATERPIPPSSLQRLQVKVIDKRDKEEGYEYSAVYGNERIGKSYSLHGATFTLQLPDGRLVIANCETKFAEKWRGPAGNRRSCRMPLIQTFEVDFNGDNAKLIWPVSIDGKKMQSETYKIIGILDQPKTN